MSSTAPEPKMEKKTSSDNNTSKSKLGQFSMKPSLPYLKLNVPLSVSSSDIHEVFANVSRSKSFQIIEMEANLATAVNKEPFSIKKLFLRCLPFNTDGKREGPGENMISAVRL